MKRRATRKRKANLKNPSTVRSRIRRKRLKAAGLCIQCATAPIARKRSKSRCVDCLMFQRFAATPRPLAREDDAQVDKLMRLAGVL